MNMFDKMNDAVLAGLEEMKSGKPYVKQKVVDDAFAQMSDFQLHMVWVKIGLNIYIMIIIILN